APRGRTRASAPPLDQREAVQRGLLRAFGGRRNRPLPLDAVERLHLDRDGVAALDAEARRDREEGLLPARALVRRRVRERDAVGKLGVEPDRDAGEQRLARGVEARDN